MELSAQRCTLIESLEARQLLAGDGLTTARAEALPIQNWISTYVFKVVYNGGGSSIDPRTIDDSDLVITGPNGFSRKARLHRIPGASNPAVQSVWYKMSAPGGVWDAGDNGTYAIRIGANQVRNAAGSYVSAGAFGSFAVNVAQYPSQIVGSNSASKVNGVDARAFGAIPNDGVDDTAAIQRAIDSLPRDGDGVPDGANPLGGVVALVAGTYNTSSALRLPTAVVLRGVGSSTLISNTSSDSSRGAIELYSYASHGFNILAGVEDLSIVTTAAKGVRALPLGGDLVGLRLKNFKISAGSTAIDLREVRSYSADIRNVTVENPGSTALWIGSHDWGSAVNRVSNFRVIGTARSGFRAEQGLVVLGGDINVDGISIADTGAPVSPLFARGSITLRGLKFATTIVPPENLLMRFDNCFTVDIDRLDGINSQRRIALTTTRDVRVETLALSGGRLADALSIDSASHLTIQTLRSSGDPGSVSDSRWIAKSVAALDGGATWTPSDTPVAGPVSRVVVLASEFGAVPNDGVDDTDAIQLAIDSLPDKGTVGGLVLLGAGRFNTSRPIELPSGVWLRGQGNATAIYSVSSNRLRGAVEFVSGGGRTSNVGAGIEDLSIYTTSGAGVRANADITSGLIDARLSDLVISAGAVAVDLSAVRAYHATIEDIMASNPGGTALVLGDAAGYSADNRVIGLQLQGTARSNFVPERALIELRGDYVFENGWIEQPTGARALPLHISGSATVRGLWLEFPAANMPDGNQILFENVTRADVDRLYHVTPLAHIKLVNAQNVKVRFFNIDGMTTTLRETVTVDERSRLELGLVNAQQDSGLLDHPRVKVAASYNARDRAWLQNRPPSATANLVLDPLFSSLVSPTSKDEEFGRGTSPTGGVPGGWRIQWGDDLGAVIGTVAVENTPSGPRLKIVITSNPNNRPVAIIGKLGIAASDVGRDAVGRWRVDSSKQVFVYTRAYAEQYEAQAQNGATAARTPTNLASGDEIVFLLQQATGTYYISGVSVAAA